LTIVAIVGPDGCGKTTQAKMLVDRLKKNGYETTYVRPIYVLLDSIRVREKDRNSVSPRRVCVSDISNKKLSIMQRALMGLFGYIYALVTYIFMKLYLSINKVVVCDRYFYQFFFDLFENRGENIIKFFPRPDVTFFLDGDLDLFYSRMDNSFDASVGRDYYTDVLNLYRRIYQKYGFIQIDANLNKEAINDVIFMHLTKKMEGGVL
jgi:dTMP kinase